jgi:hypothetical protein
VTFPECVVTVVRVDFPRLDVLVIVVFPILLLTDVLIPVLPLPMVILGLELFSTIY